MTHAHMTEESAKKVLDLLNQLWADIGEIKMNEDAMDILGFLITIIEHEIERMPKW